MQIAPLFSELFSQIFPIMILLFVIAIIWNLFAPDSMKKYFSMSFENPNSTPEREEEEMEIEKAINVCYDCGEKFEDSDVFCGHCGYQLE